MGILLNLYLKDKTNLFQSEIIHLNREIKTLDDARILIEQTQARKVVKEMNGERKRLEKLERKKTKKNKVQLSHKSDQIANHDYKVSEVFR